MASTTPVTTNISFHDLLIQAAHAAYGHDITVLHHRKTDRDLRNLQQSISVKVLRYEENPTAVAKTVVDVSTKVFVNDATSKETTKVTLSKPSTTSNKRVYQFISTQGLVWDLTTNFSYLALAMGLAGGSVGFRAETSVAKPLAANLETSLGFEFSRDQEETVCVPSGKKVEVTLTTTKVMYQLGYTLEFSVPKTWLVFVTFKKPCCCGLRERRKSKYLPYWRSVRSLPNYREDEKFAYFTQRGYLAWIGESCEVNKRETSV